MTNKTKIIKLMTEYILIQDVKGKLESAYLHAPFDKALKALKKEGYNLVSLEENARLRMQEGMNAHISQNGNWVREGVIYLPSGEAYLTKNSPILRNAKEATECTEKCHGLYLTKDQAESALANAVKFPKLEEMESEYEIPTDKFGEDAVTDFAFGKIAKDYGKFLKENRINAMPIRLSTNTSKPLARQVLFSESSYGESSIWYCVGRLLCEGSTRGVREKLQA